MESRQNIIIDTVKCAVQLTNRLKMSKKRLGFLLFTGLLLFFSTVQAAEVKVMPEFSLPSAVDGKDVSNTDYAGKVLLITFFATWCPPCRQEIPTLIKLQKDYGEQGFSILGFSLDETGPKVVAKLIEKEGINYPVLMAKRRTVRDFGGFAGIPTSFLIDREGRIVKRYPGYVPHSLLEKDIKDIL